MCVEYNRAELGVLEADSKLMRDSHDQGPTEQAVFSVCCESRQISSAEAVRFSLLKTTVVLLRT